jgi:hypothetical protein
LILGVSADRATQFCSQNPTQLCCSATSNIVTPNTSTVAATQPTNTGNAPVTGATVSNTAGTPQSSSGVNPLFIGAGVVGAALIAIVGSAFFFMRKPSEEVGSRTAPTNEYYEDSAAGKGAGVAVAMGGAPEPSKSDNMEVIFEYQANLFDELSLSIVLVYVRCW